MLSVIITFQRKLKWLTWRLIVRYRTWTKKTISLRLKNWKTSQGSSFIAVTWGVPGTLEGALPCILFAFFLSFLLFSQIWVNYSFHTIMCGDLLTGAWTWAVIQLPLRPCSWGHWCHPLSYLTVTSVSILLSCYINCIEKKNNFFIDYFCNRNSMVIKHSPNNWST